MNQKEIEARQEYLVDELVGGCYPVQSTIAELCALVIEWTEKEREKGPLNKKKKQQWEARESAAKEVLEIIEQAEQHTAKGNSEATIHCALTAGRLFGEHGLSELAKTGAKTKAGGKAGHESVHGNEEQKNKRWDAYCASLKSKIADPANKYRSVTDMRKEVAKEFNVKSYKTIERRTKDITDTRKKK